LHKNKKVRDPFIFVVAARKAQPPGPLPIGF
jgi:hypothetical protein